MPISNHLRSQDLQHCHLIRPVLDCLISSDVFVAAEGCLAAMLQKLDLVEKHVVALVVALRRLLFLGTLADVLLGVGLCDGLYLIIRVVVDQTLLLHRVLHCHLEVPLICALRQQ